MPEKKQSISVFNESLERKHETSDRSPRNVIIIAVSAAALVVFSLGASGILFGRFSNHRQMQQMQPLGIILAPSLEPLARFPKPNLQIDDDHAQMRELLTGQKEKLNSYGWVNRSNGIVRIPIERAMELILIRGLPTRTNGHSQTDGSPLQLIQSISQQQ